MNDPTRNKKPPEANLKDCVLSLAEIVESLVGIQQQNARTVKKKDSLGGQSLCRCGGQGIKVSDNTLPKHDTQSKFNQNCPPQISKKKVIAKNCVKIREKPQGHTQKRLSQASFTGSGRRCEEDLIVSASDASGMSQRSRRPQSSKPKVIVQNCVRIREKASGHTQKRLSQSSVIGSGRHCEEDLNISASDASGMGQRSRRLHSKKKKPGALNQSGKCKSGKGKFAPSSDLDDTRESENEYIHAQSSGHWECANEPNALVSGSSNKESDGSEFYSIEGACVLWDMVERLQCIEEELECLAQRRRRTPSNECGEHTSKYAGHSDEGEKSCTDESTLSMTSQTENSDTFKNECIDELKEVFAELQVEVPDELWTDPRKSRFFLDIIYDLLDEECEEEDEDGQNTKKGGLSNDELNRKKELFTQELGKSLEIKTPPPSAVVKLLELIYLQKGDNQIGRIKTHSISRDNKGRITQNSSIVSGKVDPFRLLVLNSGMGNPSRDNIATKVKKEKSDADMANFEDEAYGLIDQNVKGQYSSTQRTRTISKISFPRSSTEHRWCYCPGNDKNENANVSIKPDPDTQELPDVKTEGLLGKEQKIPGDTEGDHKILDLEKQDSHNIETSQESKILETTKDSEQKFQDLQKVTSLIANRSKSEEVSVQTLTQRDQSTATEIPDSEEFNRGAPLATETPNTEEFNSGAPLPAETPNSEEFYRGGFRRRQLNTPTRNPDVMHTPRELDFNAVNSLISDSENKLAEGIAMKSSSTPTDSPDVKLNPRMLDFNAENSLISDSENKLPQRNSMKESTTPTDSPDAILNPRMIDFDAGNSLISDSENKLARANAMKASTTLTDSPDVIDTSREIYDTAENSSISNSKNNLHQANAVTPTQNLDVIHREIDFNAVNSLISDSESKQGEGQSAAPASAQFAPIEEELVASNAKVKIAGEKSSLYMDKEELPEEIGAGSRKPTKKHSKGGFSLFSCISSPDSKELSNSIVPHSAPNETPDSPHSGALVDQSPLIPEARIYSSLGDIAPELQNQTTAVSGEEPRSGTTDRKTSSSLSRPTAVSGEEPRDGTADRKSLSLLSPLGAPLASSTLQENPVQENPETHPAILESVNKETYSHATIASAPSPPELSEERFMFGSAVPPNPDPQSHLNVVRPTSSLVGQSSPTVPAPSRIDQAGYAGSKLGNEFKRDSSKLPEGYEALDDMIEVTLRGFEKMSNFLQKEPRLTASPSLPDDPNELNKVLASKVKEMENTLAAVIKCIQCTLVEMSKVIEKRAGIILPEAHLYDDPRLIDLYCSQMFNKSERGKDANNEDAKNE